MNDQEKYIEVLKKVGATELQVTVLTFKSSIGEYKPGNRYNLGKFKMHDDRTVFLNEVIFDFDWGSYVKNFTNAKAVVEVLENRNIPYYIFASGGKGIHIHIFFDKINLTEKNDKELMKKAFSYNMSWKNIRLWIYNSILDEAGIESKYRGRGKMVDTAPISFNYFAGSSHLIRDCGGRKITKKSNGEFETLYKTYLTKEEFNKKKPRIVNFENVKYPQEINTFHVDIIELCTMLKEFIKSAETREDRPLINERLDINYLDIDGVLKIKEGLGTGQRTTGALILSVACKIDQLNKNTAKEVLNSYVDNCEQSGHRFTYGEAEQWINWIYAQEHVFWNCGQLEELGVHDKTICEFCNAKNKEAIDFLNNSEILTKVKKVLDEEVVGENSIKLLIFLLMLSKDFPSETGKPGWNIPSDPMSQNIILASDSSSGKSYVAKRIMKLFGKEDEDYIIVSRLSKNAVNYFTEINMDGKIIFIEELQGLDENTSQLRVWMSEGSCKLATVETVKDPDGIERKALVNKRTIGHPVFVSCQAEGIVEDQLLNRGWQISMDVSSGQTEEILDYQCELNKGLKKFNKSDLRVIRDALKQLKQYHYVIPYLELKALNIPLNDVRARRDFQKFATLIKCSTYLHQYQREKTEIDGVEHLICSIDDYNIARQYSESILGATFTGLTLNQIDLLNMIKKMTWKAEFNVYDVMRIMGKSHTHWHGLLSHLENLGFITAEKSAGKTTTYALNEDKAVKLIDLPTGEELLKKIALLKVENGSNMDFSKWKISKIHVSSDFHFKVNPSAVRIQGVEPFWTLNKIPDHKRKNDHHINSDHLLLSNMGKSLRYDDVIHYLKTSKNHLICIEEVIKHFGEEHREKIDEMVKKMSRDGDIMITRGKIMLI